MRSELLALAVAASLCAGCATTFDRLAGLVLHSHALDDQAVIASCKRQFSRRPFCRYRGIHIFEYVTENGGLTSSAQPNSVCHIFEYVTVGRRTREVCFAGAKG